MPVRVETRPPNKESYVFRSHNAPAVPLAAESHADTTVADTFPLDVRDEEAAALIQQVSKAALAVMAEMEFSPAASTTGLDEFLQDPAVRRPPPERGGSLAPLLETIRAAGRFGLNTHNGRMLAFIPGSGLVSSAATDLLAGVINSFTGATSAAPAMMALERDVVGWMADNNITYGTTDPVAWLVLVLGVPLVGILWWRFVGKGPLEWLIGVVSGRYRPRRAAPVDARSGP